MSKSTTREIPLSSIVTGTNFSRSVYDEASMTSLKKSISDLGLLQAVGVSPNAKDPSTWDLVYGFRRFKACVELGKTNVLAMPVSEHPLSEDVRMKMNVAENAERKDVTLMESGLRWMNLVDSGRYTVKELSNNENTSEKKIKDAIDMYRDVPKKFLPNIVANDSRRDQSGLITHSKAHAIMTAAKYEGMQKYIEPLFELVRHQNATESEIKEVRKLIQAGLKPIAALEETRKVKSKVMSKALTFKVKKRKWDAFREEHGHAVSEVLTKALKKKDAAVLAQIAGFIC